MSQSSQCFKIPLSVVAELLQLVTPPKEEEFGLLNSCGLDWDQNDLDWMDERGDMLRLPRFLELAEQISQVLQSIDGDAVITDTSWHGAQNNKGLDAFGAFLALHKHGLIVDDVPGKAATALEVFHFVFHVLNAVGGVTAPDYVIERAILMKRWDIYKALDVSNTFEIEQCFEVAARPIGSVES